MLHLKYVGFDDIHLDCYNLRHSMNTRLSQFAPLNHAYLSRKEKDCRE